MMKFYPFHIHCFLYLQICWQISYLLNIIKSVSVKILLCRSWRYSSLSLIIIRPLLLNTEACLVLLPGQISLLCRSWRYSSLSLTRPLLLEACLVLLPGQISLLCRSWRYSSLSLIRPLLLEAYLVLLPGQISEVLR